VDDGIDFAIAYRLVESISVADIGFDEICFSGIKESGYVPAFDRWIVKGIE
jgi:hypothetical protein